MIPNFNDLETLEFEVIYDVNYKLNTKSKNINGYIEGLETMKQVIYKILNTERYEYQIYSWNYGIELKDLLGEPLDYVCAELQRRIIEALIQDDRIISVDNFSFESYKKNVLETRFTVHTIFGDIDDEMVVNY